METREVVVTMNPDFPVAEDVVRDVLRGRASCRIVELPFRPLTVREEDELVTALAGAQALFVRPGIITRRVIEAARTLRVIAVHGAGVDQIDVAAATELGIPVTNVPGANANAVAELVFGLLLSLGRRIPQAVKVVQAEKGWDDGRYLGWELRDKSIGIIGAGNVGRRVIDLARAFGMEVAAYDPVVPEDVIVSLGAIPRNLPELLRASDIVTVHVPLSASTYHLIGARELQMMKPRSVLVNTSRGPIVDGGALFDALTRGHLAGAALDVMEIEPPNRDDPIRQLENVVLTPHLGGSTRECLASIARCACEDILRVLDGEQPLFLVNPGRIT